MPIISTRGVASAKALGLASGSTAGAYIEDAFSTFTYTGTGTSLEQPIYNGLNLESVNTSWMFKFGSSYSNITDMIIAPSGNIYAVGSEWGDISIFKISKNGNLHWSTRVDDTRDSLNAIGYALAIDSNENVYIAGYTEFAFGIGAAHIVKYNSSGVMQWQKRLRESYLKNWITGLSIDTAGNIIATGTLDVGNGSEGSMSRVVTLKLDTNGTELWSRTFREAESGGTATLGGQVCVDSTDNIYSVSRSFRESFSWSTTLLKYNSAGTLQYAKWLGASSRTREPKGIRFSSVDNCLYVLAYSENPSSIGNYVLTRTDLAGAVVWAQEIYSASYNKDQTEAKLSLDSLGNIYVACHYAENPNSSTNTQLNGMIVKFSSDSTVIWKKSFTPSTTNTDEWATAIVANSTDVYVGGVNITPKGYLVKIPVASLDSFSIDGYILQSSNVTVTGGSTVSADVPTTWAITQSYGNVSAGALVSKAFSYAKTLVANSDTGASQNGLIWTKTRNVIGDHDLVNTLNGKDNHQYTNTTGALNNTDGITTIFSGGYVAYASFNTLASTYVSWTFRKQPKFFDIVTYTGTGANRTIAHNLGSVPGSIIVKRTDIAANWAVYHRSLANTQYLVLNTTAAAATGATWWNSTTPTSAVFSVGTDASVNASGGTYVAYLFAHDAGGFGLTGTDNVISCGSFTTDVSGNATVTLGWEPQYVMMKDAGALGGWTIMDSMRGLSVASPDKYVQANTATEETESNLLNPTATGFDITAAYNGVRTVIYIAIRRPNKPPTTGTQVYNAIARTGTNAAATVTGVGFAPDLFLGKKRVPTSHGAFVDRLRGRSQGLTSTGTAAESVSSSTQDVTGFLMDGVSLGTDAMLSINTLSMSDIYWFFKRAPGFFDVVCYTGLIAINNATPQVVSHNLGVAPELVIFKCRSAATISVTATNWTTCTILGAVYSNAGYLNTNNSFGFSNNLDPVAGGGVSASSITIGYGDAKTNATGNTYVAYLFATCPGVSKVGSYTGNGTSQTIACGFTVGARFILIKRTDAVGNWYVWDSTRGIVAGNDPHLSLNTTAAEVTTDDSVDTDSSGFIVNHLTTNQINVSAATYIFLAIS